MKKGKLSKFKFFNDKLFQCLYYDNYCMGFKSGEMEYYSLPGRFDW